MYFVGVKEVRNHTSQWVRGMKIKAYSRRPTKTDHIFYNQSKGKDSASTAIMEAIFPHQRGPAHLQREKSRFIKGGWGTQITPEAAL